MAALLTTSRTSPWAARQSVRRFWAFFESWLSSNLLSFFSLATEASDTTLVHGGSTAAAAGAEDPVVGAGCLVSDAGCTTGQAIGFPVVRDQTRPPSLARIDGAGIPGILAGVSACGGRRSIAITGCRAHRRAHSCSAIRCPI